MIKALNTSEDYLENENFNFLAGDSFETDFSQVECTSGFRVFFKVLGKAFNFIGYWMVMDVTRLFLIPGEVKPSFDLQAVNFSTTKHNFQHKIWGVCQPIIIITQDFVFVFCFLSMNCRHFLRCRHGMTQCKTICNKKSSSHCIKSLH